MKKLLMICIVILSLLTASLAAIIGTAYSNELEEKKQSAINQALSQHALNLLRADEFNDDMLSKYGLYPTADQYNGLELDGFSVAEISQVNNDTAQNQQLITHLDNDKLTVSSIMYNKFYATTSIKSDISTYKQELKNKFISNIILTVLPIAFILFLCCAAIFFHKRRLRIAMNKVLQGDYSVRIKGPLSSEFNSMTESVNNNVIAANQSAQAQRDFVANFSHELKTPLTAIIGYADLLRSAQLDVDDTFTAASYIFNEGKRLESLSLKLMDMIVLENQEFPMRPLPASKLLQHIVVTVRPMLNDAELDLEFHAAAARIEGERVLLITLVMNLLDNARKATEAGGKIILRGTVEGDRYKISIKDNGRGIPPEELNRITEAFYMVDKSRARAQHGAGLGLALAQRIAIMHGSTLEFSSIKDKGTEVSFTVKRLLKTKENPYVE